MLAKNVESFSHALFHFAEHVPLHELGRVIQLATLILPPELIGADPKPQLEALQLGIKPRKICLVTCYLSIDNLAEGVVNKAIGVARIIKLL